ncbi:MAG: hypothetical protein ACON4M_03010 [Crocinitomicaceae bacterium]
MTISNVKLNKFLSKSNFNYENLNSFKFGGVYIIYSIDENGYKEIVKIGESNFIYRRIANYLTPINEKDSKNKRKITKKTIQTQIKEGKAKNLKYKVTWRVIEEKNERKQLEKKLIKEFKKNNNGDRPTMNRYDK